MGPILLPPLWQPPVSTGPTGSSGPAELYLVVLGLMGLYGVHRLWMLARFRWALEKRSARAEGNLPFVTVQLPLFNERTVAARLIRSVGRLDYSRERFEVQVLDDSTDETRSIVDEEVRRLAAAGVAAAVVRRKERTGFKAGALAEGMRRAHGELLCVFDADFFPQPDFLLRLVPHFADPRVGMVQARWEHANRDESTLTRAQSTLLDGHFVIEHKVRADRGLFFNFNGTAGIWRRAAIEDAGGWEHDTLTEDLDLSYRAQLSGWLFRYAPAVAAPAEVPPDIDSFKSQQHRWAKGSVQVARKLGWRIARAGVPLRVKLEAAAHLSGNTGYPLVLLLAILLPLSVSEHARYSQLLHLALFVLCTLSVILFYERSQRALGRPAMQRLRDVFSAMSLGVGMSLSQTGAVLSGLFEKTGEFVRTPKQGDAPAEKRYRASWSGSRGAELLLAAWLAWAVLLALRKGMWGSLPFLLLFFSGFLWVGVLSLRGWLERLPRRGTAAVGIDPMS